MTWSDYEGDNSRLTLAAVPDGPPEPEWTPEMEVPQQKRGAPKTGRFQFGFGEGAKARSAIDVQVRNFLEALAVGPDQDVTVIVEKLCQVVDENPSLRLQDVVAEILRKMKLSELQMLHSTLAQHLQPNSHRAIAQTQDSVVIALTDRLMENIDKRWSKLSPLDLEALHAILAHRILLQPCSEKIKAAQARVIAALEEDYCALSPSLQLFLRSAITQADNVSEVTRFYALALQKATDLAAPKPGHREGVMLQANAHEVMMDAIGHLVDKGISLAQVEAFFMAIPGNLLLEITTQVQPVGHPRRHEILKTAQVCLRLRTEGARQSLNERMRELADSPQDEFAAADRFANCLIAAANHLSDFQVFSGNSRAYPITEEQRDDIEEALQWFCDPSNLGAAGDAGLSIPQLKQASEAIGRLRFGDFQPHVNEEIETRRYVEIAMCKTVAREVIEGLCDLSREGLKLVDAMRILSRARDDFRSRGLSSQVLYEHLREHAAGLPFGARRMLAAVMSGPRIGELMAALHEVRRTAAMQEFDGPRGLLDEIESALMVVREVVDPAFKRNGPATSNIVDQLETLAPEVRGALEVFGIAIGKPGNVHVTLGVASSKLQEAVKEDLRQRMHVAGEQYKLVGKELITPRVQESFASAEYLVNGKPLITNADIAEHGHDDRALLELRMERLRNLCGGDSAVLHAFLNVASIDAMAAVESSFNTSESPFRLPDGTPGYPVGERSYRFNLLRDARGGLAVRCELTIALTHLQIADATGPKKVKLQGDPARFEYTAAISPLPRFHVKVAKPLEMNCATPLHVHSRWGYPVTTSYLDPDNVVGIFAPGGDKDVRNDFKLHVDSEYSRENYEFIEELDESSDRTYANALALMNDYIVQDAPKQVNLPSSRRDAIEAAFKSFEATRAGNDQDPVPQRLLTELAGARADIVALLERDSFPRWTKKLRQEAEKAGKENSATTSTGKESKPVIDQPQLAKNPREKWLAHRLKELSEPMADEEAVNGYAKTPLQNMMPAESSKDADDLDEEDQEVYWRKFGMRVPDAYWQEFAQRIQPHLDGMDRTQLAALRYNLGNTLRPEQREHDRHIEVLLSATTAKLQGPREIRMTEESLVLEQAAKVRNINTDLLAKWLKERRVSDAEARDALNHLTDKQLSLFDAGDTDARVLGIVRSVIAARARAVSAARLQSLVDSVQGPIEAIKTQLEVAVGAETKHRLNQVDFLGLTRLMRTIEKFDAQYEALRAEFRLPVSDPSVDASKAALAKQLNGLCASKQFNESGFTANQVDQLHQMLVALGVEGESLTNLKLVSMKLNRIPLPPEGNPPSPEHVPPPPEDPNA